MTPTTFAFVRDSREVKIEVKWQIKLVNDIISRPASCSRPLMNDNERSKKNPPKTSEKSRETQCAVVVIAFRGASFVFNVKVKDYPTILFKLS